MATGTGAAEGAPSAEAAALGGTAVSLGAVALAACCVAADAAAARAARACGRTRTSSALHVSTIPSATSGARTRRRRRESREKVLMVEGVDGVGFGSVAGSSCHAESSRVFMGPRLFGVGDRGSTGGVATVGAANAVSVWSAAVAGEGMSAKGGGGPKRTCAGGGGAAPR